MNRLLAALVVAAPYAFSAQAQTPPSAETQPPLTLSRALDLAGASAPALEAASAGLRAAEAAGGEPEARHSAVRSTVRLRPKSAAWSSRRPSSSGTGGALPSRGRWERATPTSCAASSRSVNSHITLPAAKALLVSVRMAADAPVASPRILT